MSSEYTVSKGTWGWGDRFRGKGWENRGNE